MLFRPRTLFFFHIRSAGRDAEIKKPPRTAATAVVRVASRRTATGRRRRVDLADDGPAWRRRLRRRRAEESKMAADAHAPSRGRRRPLIPTLAAFLALFRLAVFAHTYTHIMYTHVYTRTHILYSYVASHPCSSASRVLTTLENSARDPSAPSPAVYRPVIPRAPPYTHTYVK